MQKGIHYYDFDENTGVGAIIPTATPVNEKIDPDDININIRPVCISKNGLQSREKTNLRRRKFTSKVKSWFNKTKRETPTPLRKMECDF